MNIKNIETALIRSRKSKVFVATECGFTRSTLDAILKGSEVGVSKLEKLAQVLNVPVGYFFDELEIDGCPIKTAPDELIKENQTLRERLADKDSQLQDKERLIQLLMQQK